MIMPESLTPREQQIVDGICKGKKNKQIARDLQITERTVKFHCTNIYKKLEIRSRQELLSKLFVN